MKFKEIANIGVATILVNVGGGVPLVLTGTIVRDNPRHHDGPIFPDKIKITGEIEEEEEFLIVDVTGAVLPPGFPLTIAALTADIAINVEYIISILPVEA